ncbi:MAG: zinc ABC transporter substrate-binding protein [Actinobacteria bacterium]|nr:zinc ABC transporter substrate-binding protein [Actinomycetota bacterium]
MRTPWLAVLTLAGAFVVGACAQGVTPVPESATAASTASARKAITVVATFSILGDLVHNVGRERIRLVTLVGPDGDAHTFEPAPADARSLATAALIFANGADFEPWLDDLYAASGSQAKRVVVSEGLPLLAPTAAGRTSAISVPATWSPSPGQADPHAWQDVTLVQRMVERIRDALMAADPDGNEIYRAWAESYLVELRAMDAWIRAQVATIPASRRTLVTAHDALGHFARQYGFEVVGAGLGSTTESADPSAAQLRAIVADIRAAGVPAIFAENIANSRLMSQIASEAGVKLVSELYTDALGADGTPGATYLGMMRFNVESIVGALRAGG